MHLPKKKSRIIKALKKDEWKVAYISLILTIALFIWNYYNPSVIIQKETEYRNIYIIETKTETMTLTATVTATVTRANGTIENLTKQPQHVLTYWNVFLF